TYLQAAAELGLPVAILLALTAGVVLWFIYRESRGRYSALAIAALAATAGVAFHSLVDFSIQIEAVGLTMSVLAGAAFGDALAHRRRAGEQPASVVRPLFATLETVHVTIPAAAKS